MTFTAALVKEQGVEFAVVLVKQSALVPTTKEKVRSAYRSAFPGVPIVLCAQDSSGRPTYDGRSDIVRFLSNVFFEQLPWGEWRSAA